MPPIITGLLFISFLAVAALLLDWGYYDITELDAPSRMGHYICYSILLSRIMCVTLFLFDAPKSYASLLPVDIIFNELTLAERLSPYIE